MVSFLSATLFAVLPLLASASPIAKRANFLIHPGGDETMCLGVPGVGQVNQALQVLKCANTAVSLSWTLSEGNNPNGIQLSGLCLDAGENPHNNGPAKLYTCYPGLTQQTWYLTSDGRIAITGGNQCLDIGPDGPQTYQCTTGDTNQFFTVDNTYTAPGQSTTKPASTTAPMSTTMVMSTTSVMSSAMSTTSMMPPPPAGKGNQIKFAGNPNQCLTVQNGFAGVGSTVALSDCFGAGDQFAGLQTWTYLPNSATAVQLTGTNLCLDAGSNPANGVQMKVWTCYPGLYQQTWYFVGDTQHIAIYNGPGLCLDVQAGSQPGTQKPYNSLQNVQTWACSGPDPQQLWNF